MKTIVSIFLTVTSVISTIFSLFFYENYPNGYGGMVFLPFIFLVLFFLFYYDYIESNSNPFVIYGIIIMQWIRFVLMPPFCAMAGNDNGMIYINPTVSSLKLAIFFMVIEFLGVSILVKLLVKKNKPKLNKSYSITGNRIVYGLFFAFSFLLYFAFARGSNLVRFIMIDVGEGERIGDVTNFIDLIIRQFVLCSFILFFVVSVNHFWIKYLKTSKKKYFYFSLVIALINVSIIVGERRSAQVYAALCSIWILIILFPKFKNLIITYILVTVGIILFFMSVYKFFGAFLYDSYTEALSNSTLDTGFIAQTLQSYFFGPENIAISIDFFNGFNTNIFQLFFDFLRSIFGLNFIFKDMGTITSIPFNTFVYGFYQETGHVLSGAAYSYGFFGPLFIPLISSINIVLAILIENLLYRVKSLEVIYILVYILSRFITNLFVNTPPLINQATLMGFTCLMVVILANIFNLKINKKEGVNLLERDDINIIRDKRI
ncbi:hypothetical protein [Enterococcus entomosocium]|uniref:hypothetical protein n=5 Tax=Enterococcus entomosocium TaxID=3034352 RepID=UPI0026471BCC|nr:hypothetical protein [Enterococcus entomosocium]